MIREGEKDHAHYQCGCKIYCSSSVPDRCPAHNKPEKKPYTPPKLTLLASIRDTKTTNAGHKLDAHHHRSLHKTA